MLGRLLRLGIDVFERDVVYDGTACQMSRYCIKM